MQIDDKIVDSAKAAKNAIIKDVKIAAWQFVDSMVEGFIQVCFILFSGIALFASLVHGFIIAAGIFGILLYVSFKMKDIFKYYKIDAGTKAYNLKYDIKKDKNQGR